MTPPKTVSTTARMATYQRVRRTRTLPSTALRRGRRGSSRGFFIVDALSDEIGVAQAADAHIDHVGGALKVVAPDVGFDHVARDEAIGVAHEVFEERVLSRG